MSSAQTKLVDEVDVYLDEGTGAPAKVGSLRASFRGGRRLGGSSFEYAPEYLVRPTRYPISPELPLSSGRRFTGEDAPLFGVFADATPDDWGTGLIDAAYTRERGDEQPRSIGEFDHLVQQNDLTRMGALRFLEPGSVPGPSTEWLTAAQHTAANPNDARRIAAAVARFEEYEATDEDMEILGYAGSSLGGARPKATIQEADGSLWMLKLPSNRDRRVDLEAWEAVALDLAATAGLRVPKHRLIRLDAQKSSLLIERFDRAGADGHQTRVGYMSAMTAMELGPQSTATYENFADTIDHVTEGASAEELKEMFGRVALTVLVGNVDDHWKNHGFTRERTGAGSAESTSTAWRLSPVFDVNPTRAGSAVRSRRINERDDPSNRDLRLLIEGRDVYRLTEKQAAEVLSRVTSAVHTWREVAMQRSIRAGEIEAMASAFDETQLEHAERFIASVGTVREAKNDRLAERRRKFPWLFETSDDTPTEQAGQESELER